MLAASLQHRQHLHKDLIYSKTENLEPKREDEYLELSSRCDSLKNGRQSKERWWFLCQEKKKKLCREIVFFFFFPIPQRWRRVSVWHNLWVSMHNIDKHFLLMSSELCFDLESKMTDEKWMAKSWIHRKTGCDQNWMGRNLYRFQRKQTLKTTCSSCIFLTSTTVSALAKVCNCRLMSIKSTRFGTPLNLLAIDHQALSTPCVICQLFSCRRTRYFFVLFINFIPLHEVRRNERPLCRF